MTYAALLRSLLNSTKGTRQNLEFGKDAVRSKYFSEKIKSVSAKTMSSENSNSNEHLKDECKDNFPQDAAKTPLNTQGEEKDLPCEDCQRENLDENFDEDFSGYSDYDSGDESGPYKTPEQKLERLKELDNKKCSYKLEEIYPDVQMKSIEKLKEELEDCKKMAL